MPITKSKPEWYQGILWKKSKNIPYIVFVWSQYDEGNIDKEQLAEVPSKT